MGERRPKGYPTVKNSTLRPDQAAWLSDTIARNRARFGGLQMMADDPDGGNDPDPKDDPKDDPKGDDPKDEPLGEGGKKALEAEREARKQAEKQIESLKGEFDGFKSALTEALGIKNDDGDKGEDALTLVQNQLAAMQREAAVLKLANEHKITDSEDMALLASAKDDDAMKKLAERLAPTEPEGDSKSSRRPKPDRTQGGGTSSGADNSGVSHGRELFNASRGKKSS